MHLACVGHPVVHGDHQLGLTISCVKLRQGTSFSTKRLGDLMKLATSQENWRELERTLRS